MGVVLLAVVPGPGRLRPAPATPRAFPPGLLHALPGPGDRGPPQVDARGRGERDESALRPGRRLPRRRRRKRLRKPPTPPPSTVPPPPARRPRRRTTRTGADPPRARSSLLRLPEQAPRLLLSRRRPGHLRDLAGATRLPQGRRAHGHRPPRSRASSLFVRDEIAEKEIGHGDGAQVHAPAPLSFFFFILVAALFGLAALLRHLHRQHRRDPGPRRHLVRGAAVGAGSPSTASCTTSRASCPRGCPCGCCPS